MQTHLEHRANDLALWLTIWSNVKKDNSGSHIANGLADKETVGNLIS